jgi:hypothetical protein
MNSDQIELYALRLQRDYYARQLERAVTELCHTRAMLHDKDKESHNLREAVKAQ